jgi:serralysin
MTTQHPIYEILAKEIVYIIDNPDFEQPVNEFLNTTGYKIDQAFNDPNTGFQAFGLTAIAANKPSVLVVRGTSEAIDDVANNDPQGIGFSQFAANRAAIAAWLSQRNPHADIIGHSLGGAIAQIAATELMDLVGEVVTFSAPGTSWAIAEQFRQQGGAHKTVTHYIVDGDIVSLAGEAFIVGTAWLQSFTDRAIDPLYNLAKHQQIGRLLSNPPAGFTQIEIALPALNHPAFTYVNSDYLEFLAAYRAIAPELARRLTSRQQVEALRQAGFSFQQFVFGVLAGLAPEKDNVLVGDEQDNTADGKAGNDILMGKGGNDQLNGGPGKDILIGVAPHRDRPGRQEIDSLTGGAGADVFVLGTKKHVFYTDGNPKKSGQTDYALITDFADGDTIELPGKPIDYELKPAPQDLPIGIAIYLKTEDELIGIVQSKSQLSLNSSAFCFV